MRFVVVVILFVYEAAQVLHVAMKKLKPMDYRYYQPMLHLISWVSLLPPPSFDLLISYHCMFSSYYCFHCRSLVACWVCCSFQYSQGAEKKTCPRNHMNRTWSMTSQQIHRALLMVQKTHTRLCYYF